MTKPKDINDLHPTPEEIDELEEVGNILDFQKEIEERFGIQSNTITNTNKMDNNSNSSSDSEITRPFDQIPIEYEGTRCRDIVCDDIIKPLVFAVPPSIADNERCNVGVALAKMFGHNDEQARSIFIEWSRQEPDKYVTQSEPDLREKTPEQEWQSIKFYVENYVKEGRYDKDGIGLGTIIEYARRYQYSHLLWHLLYRLEPETFTFEGRTKTQYFVRPIATRATIYDRSFIAKCALIRRFFAAQWHVLRVSLKEYRDKKGKKCCNINEFEALVSGVALPGAENIDEKRTPIAALLELAKGQLKFFQTADRRAIAVWGKENYFIKSQNFRIELRNLCSEQGLVLNRETLNTGLEELEAIARRSETIDFRIRVGKHGDKHYIDLCDKERNIVEIHKDGWRIVDSCPILFIRKDGMKAIPLPEAGKLQDGIEHLRWLLRADSNESGFVLGISWLLWSMQEAKEYMNLGVFGRSGSSKSSYCFFLRDLIDPHNLDMRSPSKNERDMWIAFNQQHIYALDNFSAKRPLRDEDQNTLCRVNTGGGRGDKTNYTDEDETIFKVTKPTMINGINNCITNEDLHNRTIYIEVPPFKDGERLEKEIVYARHEEHRGIALGALLDIFTQGLNRLDQMEGENDIRMIGFSRFAKACEVSYCEQGSFVKHFKGGAKDAALDILMGEFVFEILMRTLSEGFNASQDDFEWKGSVSELFALMYKFIENKCVKKGDRYLPKAPHSLSRWLRYNLPSLNAMTWCKGAEIYRNNEGAQFKIKLHKSCKELFAHCEGISF